MKKCSNDYNLLIINAIVLVKLDFRSISIALHNRKSVIEDGFGTDNVDTQVARGTDSGLIFQSR